MFLLLFILKTSEKPTFRIAIIHEYIRVGGVKVAFIPLRHFEYLRLAKIVDLFCRSLIITKWKITILFFNNKLAAEKKKE